MTTFTSGPAAGKTLMLKRSPTYLRVTEKDGQFDALDQIDDTPEADEKLYAYVQTEKTGAVHIRCGGKAKGASGFYTMCKYALCAEQPSQNEMRDNYGWRAWCYDQDSQSQRTRRK